jgi:putative two-component system response regulator
MKLLIADDDAVVRTILADALTDDGYDVTAVADGQAALDVVHEGECRMVISDWEMPRMSGVELCRRIREEDLPGYVFIILLTSKGSVAERIEGLTAGADDFVAKPFDPSEIVARAATGRRVLAMETRDVAIFAMAKLAESRDPETGAHLERVRAYSRILAQHLAANDRYHDIITGEFCRLIYATSPLHDIGKVGIPDAVLLKPGRLSDHEFDIMKSHTTLGAQTLDAALRQFPGVPFLRMARDIAASHHERYDGTGYPDHLVGDAIPLPARIVAIADVYDALTSKRVYKSAFAHDMARSMIAAEASTHFDPNLVEAFLQTESRFGAVRARLGETGPRGE